MNREEARTLAQRIVLGDYAETWLQPKAFLHDAVAALLQEAVATATARLTTQAALAAAEARAAEQLVDLLHGAVPGMVPTPDEQLRIDQTWDAYEAACAAHDAGVPAPLVPSVLPNTGSQENQ